MDQIVDCFIKWQLNEKKQDKDTFIDYLNYIKDRLSLEKEKRFSPMYTSICITEECNLKCVHCYQKNDRKTMEYEKLTKILDDLKNNNILHLTITGGEPLIHPEIINILKYMKKLKFAVTLQTNGILINQGLLNELKEILDNKTDTIQVSLEGSTAEIHNKQRHKGFEEIISNIKLLVNNNFNVIINITPTTNNQYDIYNTFVLANELNVSGFQATPLAYLGKGNSYLEPDREAVIKQEYKILSYKSTNTKYFGGVSGELLHLMEIPYFRQALSKMFDTSEKINTYTCDAGIFKMHIGVDYEIFPCVFAQNEELSLGNLRDSSFKEIWFNNYENKLYFKIDRNLKDSKCEKCEIVNTCRGGCTGMAFEKYKDLNYPDPRCKYTGGGNDI
jgi:radical SAM protein with 4Fe4S-binding SPASM domain